MDQLCILCLVFVLRSRVCSLLPFCRLLGRCWALVGGVCCFFVTFPCGIWGQVWYLIVSFSDLCHLSYFAGRTYHIVGDLMLWSNYDKCTRLI